MSEFSITPASAIFVLTIGLSLAGLFGSNELVERSLFRPYWFLRRREYSTVIMSGFMHADLGHLFFNMVTYYFFAFPLQRRIGGVLFAVLYLLGLAISDVGSYFKHRNNPDYASLGASGAINSVLFAFIVYYPTQSLYLFFIPIPIPAPLFAVAYLAYSYYASRNARGRINHDAHISGAIFGLLFVAVTEPRAYGALLRMLG